MTFLPFGKALLCRETQRLWDFLGGVHPVELVLGFVSGLWRGIGESAVLGIVQVSVHVNVKSARGQIVALDLRSGLVLGEFIGLSRGTALSGVFRSCRVAGLQACETLRVGPPPGLLIRAYSERFLE